MKKMLLALGLSGALLGGSVAWAEEPTSAVTATEEVALIEAGSAPEEAVLEETTVAAVEAPAEAAAEE